MFQFHEVTAETDLRLCRHFGINDDWWLGGLSSNDTAITRQACVKNWP